MDKTRVLLIDDDNDFGVAVADFMRDYNYEIDIALNCNEGMEMIKLKPYSILLVDMHMENFDGEISGTAGVDFLKYLKKEKYDIPAIALSSYEDYERTTGSLKAGAVDYLRKLDMENNYEILSEKIEQHILRNNALILNTENSSDDFNENIIDILRKLFIKANEIAVHDFAKGTRGAKLYRVNSQEDDVWIVPLIVKIGWRDEIMNELSSYNRYVKHKIPESRYPDIVNSAFSGKYGGVIYSFVGEFDFNKTTNLCEFIRKSSNKEINEVIERVFEKLYGIWHESKGSKEPVELFSEYNNYLFEDYKLEKALNTYLKEFSKLPHIVYEDLDITFPNPINTFNEMIKKYEVKTYISICHGDLHAGNILIDSSKNLWLIDFERTGRFHILSDYTELEVSIKYTIFDIDATKSMFDMEEALCNQDSFKKKLRYKTNNQDVQKIFSSVSKVREMAAYAITPSVDNTEYYISLLYFTLNLLRFSNKEISREMKKVILYSAHKLIDTINHRL